MINSPAWNEPAAEQMYVLYRYIRLSNVLQTTQTQSAINQCGLNRIRGPRPLVDAEKYVTIGQLLSAILRNAENT